MDSIDEKVRLLLNMPVNSSVTLGIKELVKKEVTIEDYGPDPDVYAIRGIKIKVIPQDPENDRNTFNVYYPKSISLWEQYDNFKKFIDDLKGQKAHIVYYHKHQNSFPTVSVHMIAPLTTKQAYILYIREEGKGKFLIPYPVKNQALASR